MIVHPGPKGRAPSGTGFRKEQSLPARNTVCPSRGMKGRGIAGNGEGGLIRGRENEVCQRGILQGEGTGGGGGSATPEHGPQLEPLTLGLYSHFRNLFIIAAPARAALRAALALRSAAPGPSCGTGRTRRQGRDPPEQADSERSAERLAAGCRCAGQVRGRKDAQRAARRRPKPAGGRADARKGAGTGRAVPHGLPAPRASAGHGRTCAEGAARPRPAASGQWGGPGEAANPRPAPRRTQFGTRTQGEPLGTTGPGAHRGQGLRGVAR